MERFLKNEIERQIYMEKSYKLLDEEINKPPDELDELLNPEEAEEKEETILKYMEELYIADREKILEELNLITNIHTNSEN